ncbi:hypothetical protein QR680_015172 [Steinernema hermaphroditum]|uniref:Uncharacterized protein n=1 Tax=Steinernema hermaphroditum TaxID=289476 RepID=A0AA39IBD8_9BILA|nr:hypothetical protein QR680_015172 [Steinernema hermaphroditum]
MDRHGTSKNGSSDGSSNRTQMTSYDRDAMMKLRESLASRTRPDNLSTEFNGDDGMFSPAKWLEHHWVKEGIVNKVPANTKKKPVEKLKAEAEMDGTVLSPQRKGFTAGCRASSPKTGDDTSTDKKNNWRGGNLKGSSNGIDFKPSFQKANLESQRSSRNNGAALGNWRSTIADRDMFKTTVNRSKLGDRERHGHGEEKLPEWLDDGPSSMSDVIELKGFDDDAKNSRERRSKLRASKKEAAKEKEQSGLENVTERPKEKDTAKKAKEKDTTAHVESLLKTAAQGKMPSVLDYPSMANTVSDLEFAALLGIIDENMQPAKPEAQAPVPPTTGSRLSRFFTKNAEPGKLEKAESAATPSRPPGIDPSGMATHQLHPMTIALAAHEHSMRPNDNVERVPQSKKLVPGAMTLEDLEKSFTLNRPNGVEQQTSAQELKQDIPSLRSMGFPPQQSHVREGSAGISLPYAPLPGMAPIHPGAMLNQQLNLLTMETAGRGHSVRVNGGAEQASQKLVPGAMTLEDLEKSFTQSRSNGGEEQQKAQEPKQDILSTVQAGFSPQQSHSREGATGAAHPSYIPPPPGMAPIHPGAMSNHQFNLLATAAAHGQSTQANDNVERTAQPQKMVPGAMTLEDLEKSFTQPLSSGSEDQTKAQEPKQDMHSAAPAGFPSQQSHTREGAAGATLPPYVPVPPGMEALLPGAIPNHQLNPLAMAAAVHGHSNPVTALQDPKVMGTAVNIMTHMQIQNFITMNPNAQANPAFPAYVAHVMQQNMATLAAAGLGALNVPHPTEGAGQRHSNGPNYSAQSDESPPQQSPKVPNNFLPTSVLRQMNKASHPHQHTTSARSSATSSVVGVPTSAAEQPGPASIAASSSLQEENSQAPSKTHKSPEVRLEPEFLMNAKVQPCSQNGDAELHQSHLSRSALEQQYAMVMNAMNSGLPMGAYRPPTH